MIRFAFPLLCALALTACDKALPGAADGDDNRSAAGTVESGTISDAMLPLDTATSTPPKFVETGKPESAGGKPARGNSGETDATPASEVAPAADEAAPAPPADEG